MFGIYVGNSSACISMLKDGEVHVLVNDVGNRVTQASVEILDNERVVGVSAKVGPNNGGNVIFQNKMYLCPERVNEKKIEGYCPVMTTVNGDYEYVVDLGSKKVSVTPKEVAVEIFRYLYKIASSASQGSGDICAILTIPQNFSQKAKDEFYDAAVSGGFRIMQIISDAAAAIMAYDCLAIKDATRKILFFRVGGTSIDVSVAHVINGLVEIVRSVYEPGPSGNELTAAIFDYIARDVEMRMHFNPLENVRCRLKLYKLAEDCKHVLSTNSSITCCLETFYNGMDYSHTVTRSRIESLFTPILSQLTRPVTMILDELGMKPDDFDKVILCGGTLKVPKLQKFFRELFPNSEILITIPPDEVLAVGSAKQGNCLLDTIPNPSSVVHKVIPRLGESIFVKVTSYDMECLVPKHSLLPTIVLKEVMVQPNLEETVIEIFTGEDGNFDLIKHVVIPRVEEAKEIVVEIFVDGDGEVDWKLMK